MRKLFFGLVLVFLTLVMSCQTLITALDEPVISLHSVEIAGLNFNGAQILCKIKVENPNFFEIPFPEVGWKLSVNSNSFADGTLRNNRRLKANDSTIVEVPVSLEYLEVLNTFTSLKGRSNVPYKVALAVKFPIPVIGEKVWNLEHSGNVPLPQAPKLNTPSVSVERIDLSGATLVFSVNVENPNAFELPAPKIAFDYRVNRNSVVSSTTETAGGLKPGTTTPVYMRFSVNIAEVVKQLSAAVVLTGSVSGQLSVSFDFGIPALKGEAFNLNIPSTLPLR